MQKIVGHLLWNSFERTWVAIEVQAFVSAMTMPNIELDASTREEILDRISMLQIRLRALRRRLRASEEAATSHQCLHESKVLVDSDGPRDNGEFTYRCLTCGAVF